jgi:hypothetical protein
MMLKERCDVLLAAIIGYNEELESKWWNSSYKGFDGRNPIDCDLKEVYAYLWRHLGE